jgi:hypothetical protein
MLSADTAEGVTAGTSACRRCDPERRRHLRKTVMREHVLRGGRVFADMVANPGKNENGKP